MSEEQSFDAVVVGAGPAGATAATLVAMQGHRVLLLEKETLPVYKVGESLLPSTVHGICAILGVSEEVKNANFVRKLGGTFRWGRSPEPWTFDFAASSEFPGPTSYAYQVERMRFDKILVDNARRKGVDVREGVAVSESIVEHGRIAGVRMMADDGNPVTIRARYVVDASGHGSILSRAVGERRYSDFFRNIAIFGYFNAAKRLPPPRSGNIFCAAFDKGWFWYIPLSDQLTSVGAVIGQEHASLLRDSKERVFHDLVAECEPIRDLLAAATRVTDGPYGETRVRKDFSYCHTAFWRPGLVLVGDAACFIDPVFSSGVHLATYSGLLAARSINTCLSGDPVPEAAAFDEFQRRYLREYKYFHDFLVAFYDLEQDLDAYYWAARRVLDSSEGGGEAFIRLVGGMGGSNEPLLAAMGADTSVAHGLGQHLFPAAYAGGGMHVDGQDGAAGAGADVRHRFMTGLMSESAQLQMQGAKVRARSRPLFPGGLIPSPDGLRWAAPVGA